MPDPIRVAVIEDAGEIRDGLVALIGGTPGFVCAGAYDRMEPALAGIDRQPPDVVLIDLGLPGMSGTEGIRILKQRHPGLALVVLTIYDDDDRIFQALCGGACGYLLKKTPPERLVDGIRDAMAGGSPVSPEVARRMIALFRDFHPRQRSDNELTPHEVRVLRLLVDGHNYKTAAVELNVSVNTIAFHMKQIYEKLHVHSKSEAVAKALRHKIVS
ncbi:MAG TPA: response regulator transcription factor [Vicinamibacterales bacterium]